MSRESEDIWGRDGDRKSIRGGLDGSNMIPCLIINSSRIEKVAGGDWILSRNVNLGEAREHDLVLGNEYPESRVAGDLACESR